MNKYLIAVLILIISSVSFGDDYRKYMNQGEDKFKKDNFTDAVDNYRQAEVLQPEDPKASFNTGASLYRSGDYNKAAEKFLQTTSLTEGRFQSESYYNLGNSLFESQDYQNAINAYKNSLILDPKNEDAKFNYELSQRRLEEQQQQQQQNQDQDQQDQDDKQKQDDQQDQQNQDQQKQQDKKEQDQEQDKQQNQQQQDKQEQEEQQKPKPKKGEMTEEEAKALLDAFKQDEKEIQQQLKKYKVPQQTRRDW